MQRPRKQLKREVKQMNGRRGRAEFKEEELRIISKLCGEELTKQVTHKCVDADLSNVLTKVTRGLAPERQVSRWRGRVEFKEEELRIVSKLCGRELVKQITHKCVDSNLPNVITKVTKALAPKGEVK